MSCIRDELQDLVLRRGKIDGGQNSGERLKETSNEIANFELASRIVGGGTLLDHAACCELLIVLLGGKMRKGRCHLQAGREGQEHGGELHCEAFWE